MGESAGGKGNYEFWILNLAQATSLRLRGDNGGLNKIKVISDTNDNKSTYIKAAEEYLKRNNLLKNEE